MNRYYKLLELVKERQPKHLVEIGTWNGKRATELMAVCDCYYTGFDLFEEATRESDTAEMNVKNHEDMVDVAKRIEMVGLNRFKLIRGNTRETLPKWIESDEFQPFDFAFIDGGHSEETIRSDYEHIKNSMTEGLIVLDDWYEPAVEGFGCNFIKDGEVHSFSDGYIDGKGGKGKVSLLVVEVNNGSD
jgi:predicted O-methyltransferase YrrM